MATDNPYSLNYVCSPYNFVILMLLALLKSIHNVNHAYSDFSNTGVKTHININQKYSNRFNDHYLLSTETNHDDKYESVTWQDFHHLPVHQQSASVLHPSLLLSPSPASGSFLSSDSESMSSLAALTFTGCSKF